MKLGLRIDVDTFRGTRYGVPNLCKLLHEHGVYATFFFSVGPDNMGRHLLRLLRPDFFRKIIRSNASTLYGWDILFKGTLLPGPVIGKKLGHIIYATANQGHETGFHAWDHHAWQTFIDTMDDPAIRRSLRRGIALLTAILGRPPDCSAVPGWKCTERTLLAKNEFPFRFNSDCRGTRIFTPLVAGKPAASPQIPVTLPTYDEWIGRNGITDDNYNERLLALVKPGQLNVLTIHAEVEGLARLDLFDRFLRQTKPRGITPVPLGTLLEEHQEFPTGMIVPGEIPGREGWISRQT